MSYQPFRRVIQVLYSPRVLPWTNTATGLVFFGIGDMAVQRIVEHRRFGTGEIDAKRVGISCFAGSYMGFLGHFWYSFLDRRMPGHSGAMVGRKLFADLAVGPPFAASMFLLVGSLERKPVSDIWFDIKSNMLYLLLADWGFYIPMQYFNFKYLPPRYRVLYMAAISIVYDSALVYLLHKNDIDKAQKVKLEQKQEQKEDIKTD